MLNLKHSFQPIKLYNSANPIGLLALVAMHVAFWMGIKDTPKETSCQNYVNSSSRFIYEDVNVCCCQQLCRMTDTKVMTIAHMGF
jgi:hypothetical protein